MNLALLLVASPRQYYIEKWFFIWPGIPRYYLNLLDILQNQISGTVDPAVVTSFERLTLLSDIASHG